MVETVVKSNYSSEVSLRLEVEGRAWKLAKIGPDWVVPAERIELQPCPAEIVMTVDDQERRWRVVLVNGACYFDSSISIAEQ